MVLGVCIDLVSPTAGGRMALRSISQSTINWMNDFYDSSIFMREQMIDGLNDINDPPNPCLYISSSNIFVQK